MVYYCDLSVANPVLVTLEIMLVKALGLPVYVLFGNCDVCFYSCASIVVSSATKLCHGTTIVMLATNPTVSNISPF